MIDYENQLRVHLSPSSSIDLLSQITVAEVDRYREAKIGEGILGATSINRTITRLGQILEVAVERELIPGNAAKVGGKRRRVKADRTTRAFLRPRGADRGAVGCCGPARRREDRPAGP